MKPDELKKWPYGHLAMTDENLAEIDSAHSEATKAEPGEWRVRDGQVVRYGALTPVREPKALHFLSKTFGWIPALLRAVRTLENELRSAWIREGSAHRELREERERHRATVDRIAAGQSGPMSDLHAIVEAIELGGAIPRPGMTDYPNKAMDDEERAARIDAVRSRLIAVYARKLAAWSKGQQIEGDFHHDPDVEFLRRDKAERNRYAAEEKERFDADRKFVATLAEELKLTKAQKEAHVERAKKRVEKCRASE